MNHIVPNFKIRENREGDKIDETYYKQIVCSLMYITTTRLDIIFVVSFISKSMARPTKLHLHTTKRALRYMKGTVDYEIFYKKCE